MHGKQLTILKVTFVMSLLSILLGCKTTPLKGPDFDLSTPKVLHVQPYITIEYDMPGNMSNLMGFSEKYASDSPRSKSINLGEEQSFSTNSWKESLKADGAMWDYNIKHEASLDLTIELVKKPTSNSIANFIKKSYVSYYEDENGKIRAEYPEHSDEELGSYIKTAPSQYETIKFNSDDFLTWREVDGGYKHIYYALEISTEYFLLLNFKYLIYLKKESDIDLISEKVKVDTIEFMNHLRITRK